MSDKQDKGLQKITLTSNDNSSIQVGKSQRAIFPRTIAQQTSTNTITARCVAERSILIKNMIDDLGDEAVAIQPIPIHNVNEPVLRKVIEWCAKHNDDAPQSPEEHNHNRNKTTDPIGEWDRKFMQVDQEMLFEIILVCLPGRKSRPDRILTSPRRPQTTWTLRMISKSIS